MNTTREVIEMTRFSLEMTPGELRATRGAVDEVVQFLRAVHPRHDSYVQLCRLLASLPDIGVIDEH